MTAFIFDLDGTLADTVPYILKNIRQTLDKLGVTASDEEISNYIGIPMVSTGEHYLGKDRAKEYISAYYAACEANPPELVAFPGLLEMFEELQKHGAKLAVATSKLEKPAYDTLEAIGLLPYFSVVVHCELGCGYKPSPEPALRAMADLQSLPEDSWFIGDSIHDIACAKGAHMHAVAVTWGAASKEQLAAAHPDFICDSVAELRALLMRILRGEVRPPLN